MFKFLGLDFHTHPPAEECGAYPAKTKLYHEKLRPICKPAKLEQITVWMHNISHRGQFTILLLHPFNDKIESVIKVPTQEKNEMENKWTI